MQGMVVAFTAVGSSRTTLMLRKAGTHSSGSLYVGIEKAD